METTRVPVALRERLGTDATAGLIELLGDVRKEWTADVIEGAGDRFERRLVQEIFGLRIVMGQGFASVRLELAEGLAAVRQEMAEGLAVLRKETTEGLAAVRRETTEALAGLRKETTEALAGLRKETTEGLAAVRKETTGGLAGVRMELTAGLAGVRQEMADQRFELLKWAFLFWLGQFFAVGSLIALLVRFLRPGA